MTTNVAPRDAQHDFDFIFGRWRISNRRVVDRTDPECSAWEEFETTSYAYPIFDGFGHLELITSGADSPVGPWQGLTLRQYDPQDGVWRIWWSSSVAPGRLDAPMTGTFTGGVGRFTGVDRVAGRTTDICFAWSNPTPDEARWEQSFSFDHRRTWKLNWVMTFSREP